MTARGAAPLIRIRFQKMCRNMDRRSGAVTAIGCYSCKHDLTLQHETTMQDSVVPIDGGVGGCCHNSLSNMISTVNNRPQPLPFNMQETNRK